MTRIDVDNLNGQTIQRINIRPDNQDPRRIFYTGPHTASLTRDQALQVANALADALEDTK